MSNRRSLRTPLLVSLFGPAASIGLLLSRWVYLHQGDPNFWLQLANFFVVLLPFAFSIFFAFVPDMRAKHVAWRVCVVVIGIAFSVVLWEQQQLSMKASARDQELAITTAVTNANQHSDQQIAAVRSDVQGVKADVHGVQRDFDTTISKSTSDITLSVSKVGAPITKYAQLQFSLWTSDADNMPVTSGTISPDDEGNIPIEFTVTNISDTQATAVDVWVYTCDDCVFSKETPGFGRPAGTAETTRHRQMPSLNPGVSFEKMILFIKPNHAFKTISIGFKYSCATCGKPGPVQSISIYIPRQTLPAATKLRKLSEP